MPAKRDTKKKQPAAIYAVCGTEAFLKQQNLTAIIDRVLGKADRSLAFTEYDGSSSAVEVADVLDDLRTLPFLTDRRLVLLRDADSFITRYRNQLETYAEKPSDTGILVIECKTLPANTRLYKRITAVGQVIKCDPIKAYQVPQWVMQRCREEHGKQIDTPTATMICDFVGTDLGLLDAELAKLSLYVGDRTKITLSDVQSLVGHSREEVIWGIMSAILTGDKAKALSLWEDVWQTDRAASARAIAGIAYKIRQLLNAKHAQQAGASRSELERMMMIFRDPRRLNTELNALTIDQVQEILCQLLEADVAAKTGRASVRASVEAIILQPRRQQPARGIR